MWLPVSPQEGRIYQQRSDQQTKPKNNKTVHTNRRKGNLRACRQQDQRECITESHSTPTTEVQSTKTGMQSAASWHTETNKKRHLKCGDKERTLNQRNRSIPINGAKLNWGKKSIRHRFQRNDYKVAQGSHVQEQRTEWEPWQDERGNTNYKQEPRINEEYNIWNKKNRIEGITSRLEEAEDKINELAYKVERNTQNNKMKKDSENIRTV